MWIEIVHLFVNICQPPRHPPHGGCGLKFGYAELACRAPESSPTWGMWIEITMAAAPPAAPRTGHPPHGGCGLKFDPAHGFDAEIVVIPHMGDVD